LNVGPHDSFNVYQGRTEITVSKNSVKPVKLFLKTCVQYKNIMSALFEDKQKKNKSGGVGVMHKSYSQGASNAPQ
jgi:hypothetical protein